MAEVAIGWAVLTLLNLAILLAADRRRPGEPRADLIDVSVCVGLACSGPFLWFIVAVRLARKVRRRV